MVVDPALLPHKCGTGARPQKRAEAPQLGRSVKQDLLPLLAAMASLYLCDFSPAKADPYQFKGDDKMWYERMANTGSDYPLSPFQPQTPQYQQFDELDKHDKRIALAQIAAQLIAQNLDNRLGKAILSVREPMLGKSKNFKCNQKMNFKKYFLTCKLKF